MSNLKAEFESASELSQYFSNLLTAIQNNKECMAVHSRLNASEIMESDDPILSFEEASEAYSAFLSKLQSNLSRKRKNWAQLELKLMLWLTPRYAALLNTVPSKMTKNQWQGVCKLFPDRDDIDIKFEWLANDKSIPLHSNNWSTEEQALLLDVVRQSDDKNGWHQIAKNFFRKSEQKYLRGAKQCRERWRNYLDPELDKGKWTTLEDKLMLELIQQKGKKWAAISKCLRSRNEHAVKNRFKSLLRKFSKNHCGSGPSGNNLRIKYKKSLGSTQELLVIKSILEDINKTKDQEEHDPQIGVVSELQDERSFGKTKTNRANLSSHNSTTPNSTQPTGGPYSISDLKQEDCRMGVEPLDTMTITTAKEQRFDLFVTSPADQRETREQIDRLASRYFHPVSPNSAFKYCDTNMNPTATSLPMQIGGYPAGLGVRTMDPPLMMVITPVYRAFSGWGDEGRDIYFI